MMRHDPAKRDDRAALRNEIITECHWTIVPLERALDLLDRIPQSLVAAAAESIACDEAERDMIEELRQMPEKDRDRALRHVLGRPID